MKHPYRSTPVRPVRLPVRLRLPSGALASVRASERPRPTARTLLGAHEALSGAAVEVVDEWGRVVPASELALEDFHLLRALVTRAGLLPEDPEPARCANCGHASRVRPCDQVEFGPYLDDELGDPELDEPFDFGAAHPLASPLRLPDGEEATEARLRPLGVRQALALHKALEHERLTFTPAIVTALGIESLGSETNPGKIAAALEAAGDEALSEIAGLFDAAHYPPRLRAPTRCGGCGALVRVDAPALREFPAAGDDDEVEGEGDEGGEGGAEGAFLSEEAFSELVHSVAGPILERRGAAGRVLLAIEAGPAACDDGGVTLLGSYVPGEPEQPGMPARPHEITLYYRTFRAVHDEEGPFDVAGEIAETVDHELDHYEAFLRGEDPVDEEERGEIAREARREVGETETLRRASRALRGEVGDFVYRTWPFWLIAALVTYLLSR